MDRAAFIRHHTTLLAPPLVPEIQLHLADEALPLWEKTEEELGELGLPPPFWAFAWAGGQALARHILDRRTEVRGRTVLDFAAGSGLVGIAAARAGATSVLASDIDSFAVTAIEVNAAANGVALRPTSEDLIGSDGGWDVILAGDVFYEKPLAERASDWLAGLARRGAAVLVGDPGRNYLPRSRLQRLETYEVPVTRALEDAEIKKTSVWLFSPEATGS